MGQKASIDVMLMKLGLQHANSVTTPIELDYDNDVHDIEPLFPKESQIEPDRYRASSRLLVHYFGWHAAHTRI